MPQYSVRMITDRDVADALRALGDQAGDVIEDALTAAGYLVANAARENAPKHTGTLARSIAVVTSEKTPTSASVQVGPQVDYGLYVEFGTGIYAQGGRGRQTPWVYKGADGRFYTTRGMVARPYMRPAFDATRGAAREEFERVVRMAFQS